MRTCTPADTAYLPTLLARLTPAERDALDRFSARALHCPDARPCDEEERQAVERADRLARQGAGRGGYTRPQPRRAA